MLALGEVEGRGDAAGLGETVTLGAADAIGFGDADTAGAGIGVVVVVLRVLQLKAVLLASAVSRLAAVTTSPPPKVPSVLPAGIVAVGACPTGIGS